MDVVLARRYVFFICFFAILSYATTASMKTFAQDLLTPNIEENGYYNDQSGDLNTSNSNNNNTSTTNIGSNAGSRTPMPTAVAPSMMSSGSDTCLKSRGTGLQLLDIGLAGGYYLQDEECNRRRDARLFSDLGMMIPAISRMCQNEDNWKAMFVSGTPCPILVGGRMVYGKRATLAMRSQPTLYIPNYEDDEEYYNSVLGIGKQNEENEEDTARTISVSERFRTSTRSVD